MNTKIELQIKNATFQAYQRYAYMEIAGQCDEDVDMFEINNYINLRCNRIDENNNVIDYVLADEKFYWDIPYLDIKWLLLERVKYPICGIIKDILDDGRYVIFDGADDYYIESRRNNISGGQHKEHDGLIYGYDDINQTFSLLVYTDNVLSSSVVPQESIYRAMNSEYTNPNGFIIGAKKKDGVTIPFDVNKSLYGISEYLTSHSGNDGCVYGIETGFQLEKHIRTSDFYSLDVRALRLFWEHKVLMKKRLEQLAINSVVSYEILEEYEKIVKNINVARALQTKFIVLNDKRFLDRAADMIAKNVQEESLILGKILHN